MTAEVLARHEESQGPWPEAGHVCLTCWQPWQPNGCDAVVMARRLRLSEAALDELRVLFESTAFANDRLARQLQEAQERVARLEAALRLHNLTPTGKVRKCLPGCIACALLADAEAKNPKFGSFDPVKDTTNA